MNGRRSAPHPRAGDCHRPERQRQPQVQGRRALQARATRELQVDEIEQHLLPTTRASFPLTLTWSKRVPRPSFRTLQLDLARARLAAPRFDAAVAQHQSCVDGAATGQRRGGSLSRKTLARNEAQVAGHLRSRPDAIQFRRHEQRLADVLRAAAWCRYALKVAAPRLTTAWLKREAVRAPPAAGGSPRRSRCTRAPSTSTRPTGHEFGPAGGNGA